MSKFAFCPPDDTYVFYFPPEQLAKPFPVGELMLAQFLTTVNVRVMKMYTERFSKLKDLMECFYTINANGNRIACIYIPGSSRTPHWNPTIVYSHTNAEGKWVPDSHSILNSEFPVQISAQ